MKTQKIKNIRCLPTVKCLATALVMGLTLALPAHAVVPVPIGGFPNGPLFGLAGITANQTLQLTLSNVASAPTANCLAVVSFVDATGTELSHQSQTIAPGQSLSFDQPGVCVPNADGFGCGTPAPTLTSATPNRLQLRPVLNLYPPSPLIPLTTACGGIRSTLAIIDTVSQLPEVIYPPQPIHPLNPLAAILAQFFPVAAPNFVFLNTYPPAPIHLSVTNAYPPVPILPAVNVLMGFRTADGVLIQSQLVSLPPGQSVTLVQDQFPPQPVQPFISFPPTPVVPSLIKQGIVASVEQVDSVTGQTRFFLPRSPIRGFLGFW